jgi:hypothetical protein
MKLDCEVRLDATTDSLRINPEETQTHEQKNRAEMKNENKHPSTSDSSSEKTTPTNVRFHYIRNRNPDKLHKLKDGSMSRGSPIACVASRVDRTENIIQYGLACVHGKLDTFDYKKGRQIALGRLKTNPIDVDMPADAKSSLEILRLIMSAIILDEGTPVIGDDGESVVDEDGNVIVRGVPPTKVKREAQAWLDYKKDAVPRSKRSPFTTTPAAVAATTAATTPAPASVRKVPRFEVVYDR